MGCSASSQETGPHIIMLGLDEAGKTAILYRMKVDEVVTTIPTEGYNTETVKVKGRKYLVLDIGGQEKVRQYWKRYFTDAEGILYVVDSSDRDRMEKAKKELFNVLEHEELKNVPLVVMANKQDLEDAMDIVEIEEALCLRSIGGRDWFSCGTSTITGEGIKKSMVMMAKFVKKRRKKKD